MQLVPDGADPSTVSYRDYFIQYGDYLLANAVLPAAVSNPTIEEEQHAAEQQEAAADPSSSLHAAAAAADEDDTDDELWEELAMAEIRSEMHGNMFMNMGVDTDGLVDML